MKRTNAVGRRAVKHAISALLLAAGMLTQAGTGAAQTIELVDVANGTGGFAIAAGQIQSYAGMQVSSAGDVNGDGLCDAVLMATNPSNLQPTLFRGCYVVFGRSQASNVSLPAIESGTSTDGFFIHGSGGSGILYKPGGVSSAGDVNGDGLGDLIVGYPVYWNGSGTPRGRACVVFGKSSSAPVSISEVIAGTSQHGFALVAGSVSDKAGFSVAGAGDVNGDGLADLIVGAPEASLPGGFFYGGFAYVVFGKTTHGSVLMSDMIAGGSAMGFALIGESSFAQTGWTVGGAGDVNGDGLADVIVGAPGLRGSGYNKDGRAYVVFGKTDTATTQLSAIASGTSAAGFALIGRTNSLVGFSVSGAGDVNGDGLSDLLVGAPNHFSAFVSHPSSVPADPGRAYVVFGKSTGANVATSSLAMGSSADGFVIEGNAQASGAGYSVSAAGDLNGDGLADVLVGAPGALGRGNWVGRGRAALVLGRTSSAPVAISELIAHPTSASGFVINGQGAEAASGISVAGAGDINGNGRSDLLVGAPKESTRRGVVYAVLDPLVMAPTSTYRAQVAAGDPDRQAIGVHRYGDDETVYPDSRLWIDFDGGAGPGLAASSEVVATITRSKAGLGADPAQIADVSWSLSTNRTGYSAARVTVRYTNAEIAGLVEGHLRLLTAPTIAGPFTVAADATVNTARNEAAGTVASLPAVFALGDVTGPVPTITRLLGDPTANQNPTWSVVFDEPVGAQFTTDDIAPAGSLASAVSIESITGTSPTFTIKLVADGENLDGTLGFDIVGGAVADAFGTASVPAVAPAYTIAEVGAGVVPGDIDRDGQATVADVTALANHIVNGTPLP